MKNNYLNINNIVTSLKGFAVTSVTYLTMLVPLLLLKFGKLHNYSVLLLISGLLVAVAYLLTWGWLANKFWGWK